MEEVQDSQHYNANIIMPRLDKHETRVLITGITGFAGSHLADHLLSGGYEVWGMKRWRSPMDNVAGIKKDVKWVHADLLDFQSLVKVIREADPAYIYHLAAQSNVPTSWEAPSITLDTNVKGTMNLLEAVQSLIREKDSYSGAPILSPYVRILLAGSSEEYGFVNENEVPIKETNPLRPLSPYGVSKVAADLLGYQYHKTYGLEIIRTRAFNHTGPRRGSVFACSSFAKQIIEVRRGNRRFIEVGDLSTIRDFTDVRDTVLAYEKVLMKGEPGEVYNICTGKGIKIGDMLDLLLKVAAPTKVELKFNEERTRSSDVRILIGNCDKLKKITNWHPRIKFKDTLTDLLDYWVVRIDL